MTKHTPGPFRISDNDGRHKRVAILTNAPSFLDEDTQPYHPLVGVVYYGRRNAPRDVARATARLWVAAPELLDVAANFEVRGPDGDGFVWLVLHGRGAGGSAAINLGTSDRVAAQVALLLEQDRSAAIAKVESRDGDLHDS